MDMSIQSVSHIPYSVSTGATSGSVSDSSAENTVAVASASTPENIIRYPRQLDDARLSYDQPDPKQSKALQMYKSVAFQEKRSQIESMLNVDLYA